jgi:hypothetical protein
MAVAVEVTFHGEGATVEKYNETITKMGTSPGGRHPDPGCLFHWMSEAGGGLHVTDVWKTKEQFEAFARDKIGPIGEQVGMPKPQIKFIDVDNVLTAGS